MAVNQYIMVLSLWSVVNITRFYPTASIEEVQRNCKDHKSQLELEKKELQEVCCVCVCVCVCVRAGVRACVYVYMCKLRHK